MRLNNDTFLNKTQMNVDMNQASNMVLNGWNGSLVSVSGFLPNTAMLASSHSRLAFISAPIKFPELGIVSLKELEMKSVL